MVIVHKYKMIPFDKLVNLVRLAKSRYYMVIFPKLSSDTLVPLFHPKSRYYMIIFPKLSSDTLGVPTDLTGQFGQIGLK